MGLVLGHEFDGLVLVKPWPGSCVPDDHEAVVPGCGGVMTASLGVDPVVGHLPGVVDAFVGLQ